MIFFSPLGTQRQRDRFIAIHIAKNLPRHQLRWTHVLHVLVAYAPSCDVEIYLRICSNNTNAENKEKRLWYSQQQQRKFKSQIKMTTDGEQQRQREREEKKNIFFRIVCGSLFARFADSLLFCFSALSPSLIAPYLISCHCVGPLIQYSRSHTTVTWCRHLSHTEISFISSSFLVVVVAVVVAAIVRCLVTPTYCSFVVCLAPFT